MGHCYHLYWIWVATIINDWFLFSETLSFRALVKRQHTWLLVTLGLAAIVLAIIMTKVVTPKPPLQPVLQTPLLGIHVSVIMLAYTLFAVIMMNGILGIYAYLPARKADVLRKEKLSLFNSQLSTLSQILLYPAEFCLTAGIFIGAVWANMSWGRYWGWDPKETWALVTMLVYALLLHRPFINIKTVTKQRELLIWHICAITAFMFVLFTYFGVSYLLGGLHSYK